MEDKQYAAISGYLEQGTYPAVFIKIVVVLKRMFANPLIAEKKDFIH